MEATLARTGSFPAGFLGDGLVAVPLNAESVSVLLGGLAAIAFDWVPGLSGWFDGLSKSRKQQLILVVLAGLVGGVAFAGCRGWFDTGFACQPSSLPDLLRVLLAAAASNQAIHLLTKPSAGQG
jgi:hypothetical protein